MMKKQLFYFAIVIAIISLTGMKPDASDNYVPFNKNLWVSKFEITNGEYRQFMNHLREKLGPDEIEKFLPDSNQWTAKFDLSYNAPYVNMYHWHPAYDNYPIVNISKEAMERYCSWMTEKYNSKQKRKYKKVVFRLPIENEWMLFSAPLPGHHLPWYGNYPYLKNSDNKNVCMLTNIKIKDYNSDTYNYVEDGAMITCTVGSYKPNKLGIYDIIGNVAEMTSDNKIKGGSWSNTLPESYIDKSQDYELPDPRVGFRIVMEIIEK